MMPREARRCNPRVVTLLGVPLPRLLDDLLEFCFPGSCAVCEASCAGAQPLCEKCLADLKKLSDAAQCLLCGLPIALEGSPCPHCKGAGVAHFERIMRLGIFEEPLRDLIHQLKYNNHWALGETLADWLLKKEHIKGLLAETQALVPVPLHRWRQFTRGYNQAELIARRIAKRCGIPVVHPAVRKRNTETQTHMHSHAQRMQNLSDAFELRNSKSIRGKHVVVIDDVMTTGATLQTLARALKPAKPASLCAIVVAVADPMRRGFEAV
jgi:ComF family protein